MKPWLGICLSLLVASCLHAVVLLAVRMTGQRDAEVPAIEVALQFTSVGEAAGTRGPFTARRDASVAVSAGAARLPASNVSPVVTSHRRETPLPAPAAEPVAEASGPTNQAATQGGRDAAAGVDVGATVASGRAGAGEPSGQGAGGSDEIVPARPKAEILPNYPRSAIRAGLEGTVRVTASIDESGVVISAEVLSSSGHEALDKAALQAVQRAHFEPAWQAGKAVPWHLIIPVRFKQN